MKYKVVIEDKEIDKRIREIGIREVARRVGLSNVYILYLINNKGSTIEAKYLKIKEILK